jgi:hypothetical protein
MTCDDAHSCYRFPRLTASAVYPVTPCTPGDPPSAGPECGAFSVMEDP